MRLEPPGGSRPRAGDTSKRQSQTIRSGRQESGVGDALREFRRLAGLTQQDVATQLGVVKSTVSTWESGNATPSLASARDLDELYSSGTKIATLVELARRDMSARRPALATEIRKVRRTAGVSQSEFGRRIGLSKARVSELETWAIPSLRVVRRIDEEFETGGRLEALRAQGDRRTRIHNFRRPAGVAVRRPSLLRRIRRRLVGGRDPRPVVLTGPPGSGKTRLAIDYFFENRDDYDVAWRISSADRASLDQGLLALAKNLGLKGDPTTALAAVSAWFQENERWLLLLDDVDYNLASDMIVPGWRGHVITTGAEGWNWSSVGAVIAVDALTSKEAEELLTAAVGDRDHAAARAIADQVGHYPLSLGLVAAHAREQHLKLRDVLAELATAPDAANLDPLLTLLDAHDGGRPARELLLLLTFLAPTPVPVAFLEHARSELPPALAEAAAHEEIMRAILAKVRGFCDVDEHFQYVRIHEVTQDQIRSSLAADESETWVERTGKVVRRVASEPEVIHDPELRQILLPHLVRVVDHLRPIGSALFGGVGLSLADFLARAGQLLDARELYSEITEATDSAPPPEVDRGFSGQILEARLGLVEVLREKGELAEAGRQIGMAIREAEVATLLPLEVRARHLAGWTHRMKGELEQSLTQEERAVELAQHLDERVRRDLGVSYADLLRGAGDALRLLGWHARAYDRYIEAYRLAHDDGDSFARAGSLWGLALMSLLAGELSLAWQLTDAARSLYALESKFHDIKCTRTFAEILVAQGDGEFLLEADTLFTRVQRDATDIGDRMTEARCMRGRCVIKIRTGYLREADYLAESALELCRKVDDRIGVMMSLVRLGDVRRANEDHDAALLAFDEAVAAGFETRERYGLLEALRKQLEIVEVQADPALAEDLARQIAVVEAEIETLPSEAERTLRADLDLPLMPVELLTQRALHSPISSSS
jgi:DNA-binding transcriptional regulator YiaG/tetratricopeptide (TPR) repeat protein